MSLRTLMQAGPAKANDLFARLLETSDGAVKTREKLFAELKGELELHTSLEEQHLFPILRRNAETKELVGDAIKDNKELRTKLAELGLRRGGANHSARPSDDCRPTRRCEWRRFGNPFAVDGMAAPHDAHWNVHVSGSSAKGCRPAAVSRQL
jgi:hypothetical protein